MNRRLNRAFRSWIQLEQQGRDWLAERALQRVFRCLPELPLPAGLADRILRRAGLPPLAVEAPSLGLRLTVGFSLLMVAAGIVLLPGSLSSAAGLLGAVSWTNVALAALVGLAQRVGEGVAVWRALSDVAGILAEALRSAQGLAVLSGSTLLSAAAFRLLYGLMTQERRAHHAGSL